MKKLLFGAEALIFLALILWVSHFFIFQNRELSSSENSSVVEKNVKTHSNVPIQTPPAEIPGFDSLNSKEKAVALVKAAIQYYQTYGKETVIAAINNLHGPFVKGRYYVFMIDLKGITLAHAVNPYLVNRSILNVSDTDGKFFMKEMLDLAKSQGSGWVDYKWVDPENQMIESKSSYIERVKNADIFFSCGIYKSEELKNK